MEIISATVDVLITIVTAVGGGFAAFGGMQLFQGYSNDNGAKQATGWAMVAGGGGIILLAQKVFPMIITTLG
ncbi:MAG: Maff2 family mobile element protein [Candidatus Fimivivens sp.]